MRLTRVIGIIGLIVAMLPLMGARNTPRAVFAVYEDWSNLSQTIRADRWRGSEVAGGQEITRKVKNLHLNMRYRMEGFTNSDTGFADGANILSTTNPTQITQMAADAKIKSYETHECATNPRLTRVRTIRLEIIKFNDGSSTGPSDRTGDHLGRVQVVRDSDSTDPPEILQVVGSIHRCQNADCSDQKRFGGDNPLGPVTVGKQHQVRVIWDQANHQFLFGLNTNADVAVPYTASDSAPAVQPEATLSQRATPANCTSGRIVTDSTNRVYKVYTNAGAIIP
jgi:hypothetical protein